jgi:hypothetical protein
MREDSQAEVVADDGGGDRLAEKGRTSDRATRSRGRRWCGRRGPPGGRPPGRGCGWGRAQGHSRRWSVVGVRQGRVVGGESQRLWCGPFSGHGAGAGRAERSTAAGGESRMARVLTKVPLSSVRGRRADSMEIPLVWSCRNRASRVQSSKAAEKLPVVTTAERPAAARARPCLTASNLKWAPACEAAGMRRQVRAKCPGRLAG